MANSQCRWEWREWLAAGVHGRNCWRLPDLLTGMLLASDRRTVTTWLRAAAVSDDYQDYYYFLASVGRKSESIVKPPTGDPSSTAFRGTETPSCHRCRNKER